MTEEETQEEVLVLVEGWIQVEWELAFAEHSH